MRSWDRREREGWLEFRDWGRGEDVSWEYSSSSRIISFRVNAAPWSAGRPRPAASLPDERDARRSIARLLPPESVTHSAASVILYRPYYGYFNSEYQRGAGSRHH